MYLLPAVVCHRRITDSDSILMTDPIWIDRIINGKDWEIRAVPCWDKVGKSIFLAGNGTKAVSARAVVVACHGPLTEDQWRAARSRHMVKGPRRYGARTFAWELTSIERIHPPIKIKRTRGAQIWQTGPGRD